MYRSLVQQSAIRAFENSELLQKSREHLPLKEKRELLHEQFLEFMKLIDFEPNYETKSYIEALDLYEILHILDVELVVKMGVQFNLWGETLYRLGTEKHKKYLRQTEKLEILGCFAMTEIGHGSNISKLETTATYNPSVKSFIIHSPTYTSHKFWIGQSAMFAHYCILFAQLYIREVCYGVHPFIVPLRDVETNTILEGITIKDCGYKNGLNSIDNGEIEFNNVIIPYDNLLDKYGKIHKATGEYLSGRGRLSKMLNELTKNRFGLGEGCNIISKYYLKQTIKYSLKRKQFGGKNGEEAIMDYPTHKKRLYPLLAKSIILNIYCKNQRKFIEDKEKSHISSIISKVYGTWGCIKTLQECREACGGHGYHLNSNFGKIYKDIDIYCTFEGDNNVLLQQLFQVYLKKAKKELNTKNWFIYKYKKYSNNIFGNLYDCFDEGILNFKILLKNIDYIIKYKVINILLLLKEQLDLNMDPFYLWRKKLNDIVSISKIIAFKEILEDIMKTKRNYMINYLIKLFIVCHIKEHLSLYSQFMKVKSIMCLDRYEEALYQHITSHLPYYLYILDIPDIKFLQDKNHLKLVMSKL